jgi:SAM-dependent methyltransferase
LLQTVIDANRAKAVFDDIYTALDPRGYFSVLGSLDYMIPDVAEPVIRQLLSARAAMLGDRATVLDVGCSYGINAAAHRFPVNFAGLRQRYARREMMQVSPDEMLRLDSNFFASWPDTGVARFIGLDASRTAIDYARRTGLHVGGVAANLETGGLSPVDAAVIGQADVVLSTGAIGYVTERTYRQILGALTTTQPWIISFVLRMFPYDDFEALFAEHGLVTERLSGATFVQRRFRDEAEFQGCLAALEAQGHDVRGLEADGLFHAELFVSRPEADVRAMPLDQMVTISSGRFSDFGSRFVQVGDGVAIEA